jgi:NAD(P)H-hydrate epimerase
MSTPILSIEQMRQWEQATWAAGIAQSEVIRQAGQAVAHAARRLTKTGDRILVLAGKGHNGDDARVAAKHLSQREVRSLDVQDPQAAQTELSSELHGRPVLIIDGLFGIGLSRLLDPAWIRFIDQVNASRVPVLSVDVPSGLNADNGVPQGTAIQAMLTLTLGAPKKGLLAPEASAYVGGLRVAPDIGLVPCPISTELQWTLPEAFAGFPPRRLPHTHKGTYGHVAVIAGSLGYHGAAVLAARGALRSQPGLVTVYPMDNTYLPVAAQLQAAMVHSWHPNDTFPSSVTAAVAGPGLADPRIPEKLKVEIARLWQDADFAVIADASALEWLSTGSTRKDALRCLTPHPGEAARMLNTSVNSVQSDRPAALRRLSQLWGNSWVVLKGHHTLIGCSTGPIFVNPSGNPHLAQGGSGDVLAGFLGGLLAQPELSKTPDLTIRYAVWQHGACADALQENQSNWTIEDLLSHLGNLSHDPTMDGPTPPSAANIGS